MDDNLRLKLAIGGTMVLMILIGMLLGYYIGVRIAENFYLEKLENCVTLF